jgi:alkylation response protein AidB-like acyl-CoA dehydrogenase
MNLDFSDDQKFLQDEAKKFFDKEGGLANARRVMDESLEGDKELWQKIVELGWTGIRVPEAYEGLGLGHLELCVIAEELGRSLAPVPFSSSVYFFTEAIIKYGSEAIKTDLLPKLVSGEVIGTYGIAEQMHQTTESNLTVSVASEKINGIKIAVPDAGMATHMIVVVKSSNGSDLRLLDLGDSSVTITQQKNIDTSRAFFKIEFKDTPSKLVGEAGHGWAHIQHLLDQAAVLFAFEQVGGSQAALDMAKAYSLERFAFGRQIGSYQAIKHKLADMYIALTLAKSNCYYGAWALSSESAELPLAAATARVSATKAFQLCSKENIQTHGGNGFTWEYDCHLFYKRSKVLSVLVGSESTWKEKLVSNLEKTNTLAKG